MFSLESDSLVSESDSLVSTRDISYMTAEVSCLAADSLESDSLASAFDDDEPSPFFSRRWLQA